MLTFTKRPAQPQAALAEAAGLRWLAEASASVVEVVDADGVSITTVGVDTQLPTPDAAFKAGEELATIHLAGAPAFGSPPLGWAGPNYIGTQEQACLSTSTWGRFYTEQRVLPFARRARRRNHLTEHALWVVEAACDVIRELPDEVPPARIHGDLWFGNLLFGSDGPIFIDPAAHGGHPETDLAMLDVFGAPYLDEIRAGYLSINPLPAGWRERTPMHQLHPLAVHAASFGPNYGVELFQAAKATLKLLD
ncbi:fructosamine kinase family protein [Corynebacterium crudilactis]|uniref:Fructosamine kinase n=1 Tax=Corynebacterium crudilactis TaxID=1652495 RepID=A0A172QVK9_9CORY|nr:fructosamine kinase family protein [Corynebacterium crudilactis]ANE04742.1 fructosamine kinase [Corynebacterium crudilactis]